MATVYTIYAGFNGPNGVQSNRETLFRILAECGLNGYTVIEGTGMYNGVPEPGASVILIAPNERDDEHIREHVAAVANEYKDLALQEEVWVTRRQEDLLII